MVQNCIAPFQDAQTSLFNLSGPQLSFGSSAALAFGMALHELCTNAVKYGALSLATGHVDIHWSLSQHEGKKTFTLIWKESGGPTVKPPTRVGFGSKIIEQILAQQIQGTVNLTYETNGVVCVISAPLESVQATAVSEAA